MSASPPTPQIKEPTPQQIKLIMEKQTSYFDEMTLCEDISIDRLEALFEYPELEVEFDLKNYSQKMASLLYANQLEQLKKYREKYNEKTKLIEVNYKKSAHQYGRPYVCQSLGLTAFSRKIRNTLIDDDYFDVDLKNAQVVIIQDICNAYNIKCDVITNYCINRDNILTDVADFYEVSKSTAKKLFIRLAFCGTFEGWLMENNIDENLGCLVVIDEFYTQINEIAETIRQHNPIMFSECRKNKYDKHETANIIGSFFSLYLQEHETRIMEQAFKYLQTYTNIIQNNVLTYEFDGFKLLKKRVEIYGGIEKLITNMNAHIHQQTGFSVIFEDKKITERYDISEQLKNIQPKNNTVQLDDIQQFEETKQQKLNEIEEMKQRKLNEIEETKQRKLDEIEETKQRKLTEYEATKQQKLNEIEETKQQKLTEYEDKLQLLSEDKQLLIDDKSAKKRIERDEIDTKKLIDNINKDAKKQIAKIETETTKQLADISKDAKKQTDKIETETTKQLADISKEAKKQTDKVETETTKQIAEFKKDLKKKTSEDYKKKLNETRIEEKRIQNSKFSDETKSRIERWELTHGKIIHRELYWVIPTDGNVIFKTQNQLVQGYAHLDNVYDPKKQMDVPFIYYWIQDNSGINAKDNMGVYPKEELCPDNMYNIWKPFPFKHIKTDYTKVPKALKFFLKHIRVLCNHDEEVAQYIEYWIAQMIQYPERKSICPVFCSRQGAGKGTFMEFIKGIIGADKYYETSNPSRDIWGQFNTPLVHSFFINLNEMAKKDTADSLGKIKALITDATIAINTKGCPQYDIISYHRFCITTNKEDPIESKGDDRRLLIMNSSNEKCGDKKYFDEARTYINDPNALRTIYDYFMDIPNMDKFGNLKKPITEYQKNIQDSNKSYIELFIETFVKERNTETIVEILFADFFNLFQSWIKTNNMKYDTPSNKVAQSVYNLELDGIVKGRHTNRGNMILFDITKLKQHFNIGVLVDFYNMNEADEANNEADEADDEEVDEN